MPRFSATYRHSLRESAVILALWLVCFLYTCSYCYLFGYLRHEPNSGATGSVDWAGPLPAFDREPDSLITPLGLGIPDWVFYGVFVPWAVCIAATFWFCLCFFADDDLGQAEPEGDAASENQP